MTFQRGGDDFGGVTQGGAQQRGLAGRGHLRWQHRAGAAQHGIDLRQPLAAQQALGRRAAVLRCEPSGDRAFLVANRREADMAAFGLHCMPAVRIRSHQQGDPEPGARTEHADRSAQWRGSLP